MLIFGIICICSAVCILYLKYRVICTGKKCKGKIIGIADQNAGYNVGGTSVKKHSYVVQIQNQRYYTSHGCLFISLGKRKIGQVIVVFKSEKYGEEVFKCFDFRIEMLAFILILFGIFCIIYG